MFVSLFLDFCSLDSNSYEALAAVVAVFALERQGAAAFRFCYLGSMPVQDPFVSIK